MGNAILILNGYKTMKKWNVLKTDADLKLMSRTLAINEITARVMVNRGIRSKNAALTFLSPSYDRLLDTLLMEGAEPAINTISEALDRGWKIRIYGDYDVDGVMGTVILLKVLRGFGASVDYYIPHRSEEGYGLNMPRVRDTAEQGIKLLITVDNGITAMEEIAEANRLGIKTVVIDHHEPGEGELPAAEAIVDPKRKDCAYPFKSLCAAGLAYKLAEALCEKRGIPFKDRDELLVLAAIATLCDIVDLNGENRILVRHGLDILNNDKNINPGLGSLIEHRNYSDKNIDAFAVGYIFGPCINATGRLDSASLAVKLLLSPVEEVKERLGLAQKLTDLNDERKSLTTSAMERALALISNCGALDKVLVLVDKDMHESVAGIVAGRVRDAVNRPCVMLTKGENAMKGSGRSIEGFDLFSALYAHRHLFARFGGHSMAAGLTLPEGHIPALRQGLNTDCNLTEEDFCEKIDIDHELALDEIDLALSYELARLAPFGKGNPEPMFCSHGLLVDGIKRMDEKNTLIFNFRSPGGRGVKGIAFGLNEKPVKANDRINAVYTVETNIYNKSASVQMRIKDFIQEG
jgi:single-stranded-DNA-specific exonuclease